ncbi:hypothetical protein JCM8208_007808 [Rhodotorula glutinis]
MDDAPFLCTTCRIVLLDQAALVNHQRCKGHSRRAAAAHAADTPVPPGLMRCTTCPALVLPSHWPEHERGKKHQAKLRFERFYAATDEASKPQHGVELVPSGGLDFGLVEFKSFTPSTASSNVVKDLVVKAGSASCTIIDVQLESSPYTTKGRRFTASSRQVAIPPNGKHHLSVHFHPRNEVGSWTDALLVTVETRPAKGAKLVRFILRLTLRGKVGCGAHVEELGAKTPYVPKEARHRKARAVNVVAAPGGGGVLYLRPLVALSISASLRTLLEDEDRRLALRLAIFKRSFVAHELSPATFAEHWSTILKAERVQQEFDAHSYDLDNVPLKHNGGFKLYFLEVPGLAEKRPSVMRGDVVNVRIANSPDTWHQGRVVEVRLNDVGLPLPSSTRASASTRVDVQFVPPPTTARRQLTTLKKVPVVGALLFPSQDASAYPPRRPIHEQAAQPDFFDRSLDNNPEQRDAVLAIVHESSGDAPFILFGPPGTGKTTTLVEAIKQLVMHRDDTKILITAPSNAAADLFCVKLGLDASVLLRLNAPSRTISSVPADVLVHSLTGHGEFGEAFDVPSAVKIETYRVVVTTCMSAFMLVDRGLDKGHFSHIIVDEAGQATEPETYIPISLAGPATRVVLAGDPKQLGPIIRLPFAERHGLGESLLERLMSLPIYSHPTMRGISHVKLLRNFRSHKAILSVPNELWYDNELVSCAPASVTGRLSTWSGWPEGISHDFPVLFHAVRGEDEREGTSPSYFSVPEVTVVAAYVNALLHQREGLDLEEKDIGIISPYRAQVSKIRKAVNRPAVEVGSTEQYQGAERSVIIISTVRSNEANLAHDARFALGFISHPKRLNVALTRAQAALIVVGNPEVLAADPSWRKFLLHAHEHGGWAGEEWDAEAAKRDDFDPVGQARDRMDDLATLLGGVGLEDEDDSSSDE